MRKGLSQERMRYCVPGVCNRFLGVHTGFIFLCALVSVMAISITISAIVINGVQELEPKVKIVFYCDVDDAAVDYAKEKYATVLDLYFIMNGDDKFLGNDTDDFIMEEQPILVVYNKYGERKWFANFEECGLQQGVQLDTSNIDNIIALVKRKV